MRAIVKLLNLGSNMFSRLSKSDKFKNFIVVGV